MAGLFTSLGLAGSALAASSAAIRTVGQNIANVNTEGYTRQRVDLSARAADQMGRFQLGTGVDVTLVERIMDQRMEELLRDSGSTLGNLASKDTILGRIEDILGDLGSNSIGGALSKFFDAAQDLANRPEDHAARTLFIARGEDLASAFRGRDEALRNLRNDIDLDVTASVEEINRICGQIAELNDQVVGSENGGINAGSANDLRDRREALVKNLSQIISVKAVETSSGAVNVLAGSDFLVIGNEARSLELDKATDGDVVVSTIRFHSDGQELRVQGGKLAGLLEGRDQTVLAMRDELDTLARAIISQVNTLHAGGQGLLGWSTAEATLAVRDPWAPLSAESLLPPTATGSFEIKVRSAGTDQTETFSIHVDPSGSLQDLATGITAALATRHPSVTASVTNEGRLRIASSDPDLTFTFANDVSGALAGLGLGTFFTGRSASEMDINQAVEDETRLIATGRGDGPTDSSNIAAIAALRDAKLLDNEGASLEEYYQGVVGALGVNRAQARDLLENQRTVDDHLLNERSALSGVNIDDESLDLIRYQRAYQGAARFLSVIDTLLEALLNT